MCTKQASQQHISVVKQISLLDKEEKKHGLLFKSNIGMGNNIPSGIWGGLSLVHCGLMVVGLFYKRQSLFKIRSWGFFQKLGIFLFCLELSLFSS